MAAAGKRKLIVVPLRKKLAELGGDVEIRSMRGIGYILRLASGERLRAPIADLITRSLPVTLGDIHLIESQ